MRQGGQRGEEMQRKHGIVQETSAGLQQCATTAALQQAQRW